MKTYEVTFNRSQTKEITVTAATPDDALRIAVDSMRGTDFSPMFVDEPDGADAWDVIGRCEQCETLLLEEMGQNEDAVRPYVPVTDEEGDVQGYLCRACADKCEQEEAAS